MKTLLVRSTVVTALIMGAVALVVCFPPLPHLYGQEGPPRDGRPGDFGPPRGPGRGGFGGPPGFGGPMGPGGMPPSNVMLVMASEVQAELALTDPQKKQVGDLQVEMQEQMREAFSGINFQEIGSLSEEERNKRFTDMRTKSEAAMKLLDEKLNKSLDQKQVTRLKQLALQRDVIASLVGPDLGNQLMLTDDQQAKLREVAAQGFPPFGPPEARKKAQADALAVLTEPQKKQWNDLTGKSFTFPEP